MHSKRRDLRDYRWLAEESRNKAAADAPILRDSYLALAVSYDKLADTMERQPTDVRLP